MAKKAATAKAKKEKSMEEALWESCNKMRGSVEPSEYKHVVLSLIFLKYAGDHFEQKYKEICGEYGEDYAQMVEFYTKDNVFFIPEACRWSYIMENAKQDNIFQIVDDALTNIERSNKQLAGALPSNYYSNLGLDKSKFASLLDEINKIDTLKDEENDIVGRVYEYFLGKFAIAEGKGKGEFYTPKSIVNLIAEMIEPYDGKIYDPCCGSGGMFVQSLKFVGAHGGNQKNVSVYGQEYTKTTYKLARMNLAIRGISADIRMGDTFHNDQHKDLKADYIMANPPFNQSGWRADNELTTDPRWAGFETPPTSNANYGWILNILSKLSTDGVAGFILSNGALSADGTELAIRRKMLEMGKVEVICVLPRDLFYTTDISVSLWILNNNKKARVITKNGEERHYRDRENEVLFFDLRRVGKPYEKKYVQLMPAERNRISNIYHNWQQVGWEETYEDIPEFCCSVSKEFLANNNWNLAPSYYIKFEEKEDAICLNEAIISALNLSSNVIELQKENEQRIANAISSLEDMRYSIEKYDQKPLSDFIVICDEKNTNSETLPVVGLNIKKQFMPTVANLTGVDLSNYKVLRKGRFVFSGMQTGRDECIRVGLYDQDEKVLITPAYTIFEIDESKGLLSDFLFLNFLRKESDRMGWFYSDSSVRANLDWNRFVSIKIPIPPIELQRRIVELYKCCSIAEKILLEVSKLRDVVCPSLINSLR